MTIAKRSSIAAPTPLHVHLFSNKPTQFDPNTGAFHVYTDDSSITSQQFQSDLAKILNIEIDGLPKPHHSPQAININFIFIIIGVILITAVGLITVLWLKKR